MSSVAKRAARSCDISPHRETPHWGNHVRANSPCDASEPCAHLSLACGGVSHRSCECLIGHVISFHAPIVAQLMQIFPCPRRIWAPFTNHREINMNKSKYVLGTAAVLMAFAAQFVVVSNVEAKSSKCTSVAVPGSPGTFIVTCSTSRP